MSEHTHKREREIIEPFPLNRREEILNRLEATKNNIHSPYSWYSEDVRMLLVQLDFLHTRYLAVLQENQEV